MQLTQHVFYEALCPFTRCGLGVCSENVGEASLFLNFHSCQWGRCLLGVRVGCHPVGQCFLKGGAQAKGVCITCEPVGHAESQAPTSDLLNLKL